MSILSQSEVVNFFEQQGWEIVDMVSEQSQSPRWSVTARTQNGIRISIDEPIDDPKLNNIFVERFIRDAESPETYESLVETVPESVEVTVQDSEGLFMRAKESVEVELDDAGIIERLDEKGISWSIRLVSVGCTQDSSLDEVLSWVESVEKISV